MRFKVIISILLFGYVLVSIYRMGFYGLNYDEVLFANVARGVVSDQFIYSKIWKIPIFLMSYIGALKAYVYYFIFWLFGTSVMSVRLPVILLSVGSLVLLFLSVKGWVGKKVSVMTLILLLIDYSFFGFTTMDVGPSAIEFFLKCLMLYIFQIYCLRRKSGELVLLSLVMMLGVYNKLNFFWFVASFLLSFAVMLAVDVKDWAKRTFVGFLLLAICGFVFSTLFSRVGFKSEISLVGFLPHLNYTWNALKNLWNGSIFYEHVLGEFGFLGIRYWYFVFTLFLLFVGFGLMLLKRDGKSLRFYLFCMLNISVILFQIVLTKSATAPWHVFMLYPFISLMVALALVQVWKVYKLRIFSVLMFGVIFCYSFFVNYIYVRDRKNIFRNVTWSPKIADLYEYTKDKNNKFYVGDWGIVNQLILFDPIEDKYFENWAVFNKTLSRDERKWYLSKIFMNKSFLYIFHSKERTVFADSRSNIEKFVTEEGFRFGLVKGITDNKGNIFEIYELLSSKKI